MWHFAFGFIFALVSFVGSLIILLGSVSLNPGYEIIIIALASLFTAILVILATKGFKVSASIILLCSLTPLFVVGYTITSGKSVDGLTYLFLAFSVAAFVLLLSMKTRGLVNVLSIRRKKILQMKRNGTFDKNLAIARERWRKK
jgi:hypothetical protein